MRFLTNEQKGRLSWEREGWKEPRRRRQKRLYVNFWVGAYPLRDRYQPANWTRPPEWVEKMVRK